MLEHVKCYFREEGRLSVVEINFADDYSHAIGFVRSRILGEDNLFDVKAPVMALVQK